jgi:hypothetical protein
VSPDPSPPQARQLTSFSDEYGMQVTIVSRGELPAPSGGPPPGWTPEISFHAGVPPAYAARETYAPDKHLPQLEKLLERTPDNCGDDDCSVPVEEPIAEEALGLDAAAPQAHRDLREQALAAIDAILATGNSTLDLPTLLASAWESVKAETPEKPSAEEEEPGL